MEHLYKKSLRIRWCEVLFQFEWRYSTSGIGSIPVNLTARKSDRNQVRYHDMLPTNEWTSAQINDPTNEWSLFCLQEAWATLTWMNLIQWRSVPEARRKFSLELANGQMNRNANWSNTPRMHLLSLQYRVRHSFKCFYPNALPVDIGNDETYNLHFGSKSMVSLRLYAFFRAIVFWLIIWETHLHPFGGLPLMLRFWAPGLAESINQSMEALPYCVMYCDAF